MKALSRKLGRDIKTLRLQILTMALLVSCGVAILVASWSSYLSLAKAQKEYYRDHQFADVFTELVRAPRHLTEQIREIPGVQVAEARVTEDVLIDLAHQNEPALGHVVSYSPTQMLNKIYLRKGRFPEPGDRLEVLVHESFAKAHDLNPGDSFSIVIRGQKKNVQVSGVGLSPEFVYALSPISMFPDDLHYGILWLPDRDLARLNNMTGAFNNLIVKTAPDVPVERIKRSIDQILSPYGSLGSYDRTRQLSHLFVEDEIRQQKSMSAIIPAIFISVAAFILHTIISRLIGLHRSQIATLKSLGYSSAALAFHYWKLVSVILILGLVPAIAFAYGIGRWYAVLYERYFRFPHIDFSLSREALIWGLLAALLPGWLATASSLTRIFKLDPAEAMRPPAPASYNRAFMEKWKIAGFMHIQTKMLVRNILSRPWRSTLSVLSLAAATAILINGSFWSDIIEFVIQRQFIENSREDLEIRFLHPRRMGVLSEIARIPGVYIVEGARTVPVRLHFRQIDKNTAILAYEGISTLRRILDREGSVIEPKDDQVLLSLYYSKKYGIKTGDSLFLEVADKTRPGFTVTVGGFVEDIVGSSIYARRQDLSRWLKEFPSINTAYVKIDPAFAEQIYIKLKQFPEVITVGVKRLLFESFTATLSGMILTFTAILLIFAVTISGAVLFNMVRIDLSEKSWELASLRILGFKISTVFQVLFFQMGLQVIVSIVPGLILGYWLSYLSTKWIHTDAFIFPLVVDTRTYALAVVIMVSCYLVTGLFLYTKVKSLNMTEALKARE